MSRKLDTRDNSTESNSTAVPVGRRTVLRSGAAGVATVGGMALAGCIGDGGGSDAEYTIDVISSPAGFDDGAFNDSALEGVEAAQEDYDIALNQTSVQNVDEYETIQADIADAGEADLIICVSYNQTQALQTNAPEYPDQNWMLINDSIDEDNVSGWIEANQEMGFLAGVLAGSLTTEEVSVGGGATDSGSAHVGFVGGADENLINAIEGGYEDGVEWVDSSVEIDSSYIGNYQDDGTAQDLANSQYDNGADIVFHAAAAAGIGVFDAAQDQERYAIGVDSDQSRTQPDYSDVIVGSGVKLLDNATEDVSVAVAEGNFDDYVGENTLTVENDGIDLIIGQDFEGELPSSVTDNIDEALSEVESGNVDFRCGNISCE